MPEVTVLRSFEHHGTRRRGDTFQASDQDARKLAAAGLVSYEGMEADRDPDDSDPSAPAGEALTSSASRAGRASRKTTAKKSARGGKGRR